MISLLRHHNNYFDIIRCVWFLPSQWDFWINHLPASAVLIRYTPLKYSRPEYTLFSHQSWHKLHSVKARKSTSIRLKCGAVKLLDMMNMEPILLLSNQQLAGDPTRTTCIKRCTPHWHEGLIY
jgi:hypothetical protein